MSTNTREALIESPQTNTLTAMDAQAGFHPMGLYAWIVVSLAILVTAAVLGHVEDEQSVRADDVQTHTAIVAGN